jgi:hypothetical protein
LGNAHGTKTTDACCSWPLLRPAQGAGVPFDRGHRPRLQLETGEVYTGSVGAAHFAPSFIIVRRT